MRILLCNDDGFGEPGLVLLENAARKMSEDVWVIAPDGKRTANGHFLTCGVPFDLIRHDDRHFACTGSPADCVVAAMTHVFKDSKKPDLVIGGINFGRNVAEDAAYSGTMAIAREATFWGIPSLGLSRPKTAEPEAEDSGHVGELLQNVVNHIPNWHGEGSYLGINLPERLPAKGADTARPGRDKIASHSRVVGTNGNITTLLVPRGRQHNSRQGDENSIIAAGKICVMRYNAYGETTLPDGFAGLLAKHQ